MSTKKLLFIFLLLPSIALASDPISWTVTQSFPKTALVPNGLYVASVDFTNRVPHTMVNPLTILKNSNSPSEFTYQDLCSGKKLAHLETCPVTIYLNPSSPGKKTLQLSMVYGHNKVPLPELSTNASNSVSGTQISSQVITALPSTLDIGSTAPWRITFTNAGALAATGIHLVVSGSKYNTNCGETLSGSCYVQGVFTATKAGQHNISVKFAHLQGAIVSANTTTTASGENGGLTCSPAVPLAPATLVNSSQQVTLLCINNSGNDITIDSHTPTYPSGGASGNFVVSQGGDNCTAQTLPNTAACQLSGTYTAPASPVSSVTVSLAVNYHNAQVSGLAASTSTSTEVFATINNSRNITLLNECPFTVSWSMVGGAITDSPDCSVSGCPAGSTCNIAAKLCYYNNYGPNSGSYQLAPNGGTATTQIVQTAASTTSDQILWKGLISASTQCSGTSCQNNDCQSNGGTTSCAPGVGFQQPATEAEFTLQLVGSNHVDSYDISNVNGFSMPISMESNQTANDYVCGTAGGTVAQGNLEACDFSNVTPPSNLYFWVGKTGTACTSSNSCSNPSQICGLALDSSSNSFVKNCGNFLGFWAANQICQTDPSFTSTFGDNFSCSQVLSTPFPANTYSITQLLKCSPPSSTEPLFNSCYLSYSGASATALSQCCGCTNWSGVAYPTAQCPTGQTDSQWTTYVEPLVKWMKQACPTSYSFPYDDPSSSFQCTAAPTTEYTIKFCPGGVSGVPLNKADGR